MIFIVHQEIIDVCDLNTVKGTKINYKFIENLPLEYEKIHYKAS